ncbi:MAG: ATP-binding cassette domain-containing protein [Phycisphaerales bacterium]|nr:ATP-binding cassette domain-containing protein [Phycisphaerales bacterium]
MPHVPACPPSQPPHRSDSNRLELRALTLHKSFNDRPVLKDINLDVCRGDLLAIVGGSGSGKTVLLHMLAGLIPADQGSVQVADHSRPDAPLTDLAQLDPDQLDQLRLYWAVVFQKNALFSGSVYENIATLLREHHSMLAQSDSAILPEPDILKIARESLAAAALDVDDVLYKDRDKLSGGMAKRVAIARAIAIDPILIFYDEPTTGLDPVIAGQIHELIFNTHHRPRHDGIRRTSIVVTHDKDLLRRIEPRILMLHDGKVAFDGSYKQFEDCKGGPAHDYLQAMPVLHARR